MTTQTYIILGIAIVVVLFVITTYNRLVSGRQDVRNAWAQIAIQLKRRHDLIPNLVETVKGAMSVEKATLTAVVEARNRAIGASTPDQSIAAENTLTGALRGLLAVVESYPQLRSQENVSRLMEELSTTENKIAFSRQYYNDAVTAQNVRIASFPGNLVAGSFGFTPETIFEVPEAERAAIEAVPQVRL
jgi:LemA protein